MLTLTGLALVGMGVTLTVIGGAQVRNRRTQFFRPATAQLIVGAQSVGFSTTW